MDQLQNLFNHKVDIIAIGLQEVKSQPQNVINDALYEDSWTNAIRSGWNRIYLTLKKMKSHLAL